MKTESIGLIWIAVSDLKKAIQFYTETVGLKLMEHHEEFGWAELEGHRGGARLGLAQMQSNPEEPVKPGQNAVMTFTVANLEEANADMLKKGATLIGTIQEVPGHVRLQTATDADGNRFQVVQVLAHHCAHC